MAIKKGDDIEAGGLVRGLVRKHFAGQSWPAFLGLCCPQAWMFAVSSGAVSSGQVFQLAFHGGLMACLVVLALVGSRSKGAWPGAVDRVFASCMTLLPLAGLASGVLPGPVLLGIAVIGGMGVAWSFASWFRVLCGLPLIQGFTYVLAGFALGALGCLGLWMLLVLGWSPVLLVVCAGLPWVSAVLVRRCLRVPGVADTSLQEPVVFDGSTIGNVVALVIQLIVYALLFGNGFVFSVLQDNIPASAQSGGIALLNYGLRTALPLILMVWLWVQAEPDAANWRPVFNALMLVAAFVLLGVWYVAGLDTLVSYALVSTARNMVLMLLFLACLKLVAVSGKNPWLVFGSARGVYEFSVILGIVGYSALLQAFGPISLGENLVSVTALCVLIFLTSCFFATAQSLGAVGTSQEPTAERPVPAHPERREALQARYGLNDREMEVLLLFSGGSSKRRIAEQLCISENTVRWYVQQVYLRLGVHSRDELLELMESAD